MNEKRDYNILLKKMDYSIWDSVWRSLKLEVKEIQKQKQLKIQKKPSKSALLTH